MEREIQEKPLSRGAVFAGVAVAATIVGTVLYMERSRQEVVETESQLMANLPNQGQARPVPEPPAPGVGEPKAPPGYAVGGAGAMNAFDPRAPQAAPTVIYLPDANARRAYDAMNALGNATTPTAPATAAQAGAEAPQALNPLPQLAAVPPAATALAPVAPAPKTVAPRQTAALETDWGRPGDPRANMRVFEVEIRELHDGRMWFDPYVLNVRLGEQVRIVVRNNGDFPHSVVVGTEQETARAAAEVKANATFWRSEGNWLYVLPTEKGEIVWQFTKAGAFEFVDINPGRREAGLVGRIVVR